MLRTLLGCHLHAYCICFASFQRVNLLQLYVPGFCLAADNFLCVACAHACYHVVFVAMLNICLLLKRWLRWEGGCSLASGLLGS